MKSKFRLSLFALVLVLILSCSVLTACNGDGSDTTSSGDVTTADPGAPVNISLAEYSVIYPSSWSDTIASQVRPITSAIENITGGYVPSNNDTLANDVTPEQAASYKEILVGKTNRPESAMALEAMTEDTYIIAVIGNKIVINADIDDFLIDGIDYFANNYISAAQNGVLSLTTDHRFIGEAKTSLSVVENGKTEYKIVYREGIDADGSGVDVEVEYAQTLQKAFGTTLGVSPRMAEDGPNVLSQKILVGNVDCDETRKFLSGLAYDEYGFGVVGNKVVVAGWNYVTTKLAVNQFATYIKNTRTAADNNKYSLEIPADMKIKTFTHKGHDWEFDIPAFDGGTIMGTCPSEDGFLIQVGETTLDAYNAYCSKLASSGYTLKTSNEIGANKYALYTGDKNNVYVYYIDAYKEVRIVTSGSDVKFPEYFTPESVPSYQKVATTTVTQMELDYDSGSFGMCYIILLEDGSFIVFDGGYKGNDPAKLYAALNKLNPRTDGKIVISAWFLTHEHRDHFNAFRDFCLRYGQKGNKVEVKAAYVNFNDECMWGNISNSANRFLSDPTTYKNMSNAVGGMEIITVRTGMEFYICNAKVEILYTEEDLYPGQLNDFNDTCTVSRITLAGQTFLFLGDAAVVSQANMIEMYGSELKSDIVQAAHHGWDGLLDFYKLVKPSAVLWPASAGEHKSQAFDYSHYLRKYNKIQWNQSQTTTITPPYTYGDRFEKW